MVQPLTTGRYSIAGAALGLVVLVGVLLVMIATPARAQVSLPGDTTTTTAAPTTSSTTSTTTTTTPALTNTTPDTPDGRCQWERGGAPENPPRKCGDTYTVVNLEGDRLKVTALCEADVPCISNGNAQEVRITNGTADPVNATTAGTPAEGWYALALIGGLSVGVGFARWAFPL